MIWIYYNDSIKRVRSLIRRTEKLFLTSPCIADYHALMSFQLPVEASVLIHVIPFLNDFMSIFSATVILKLENFAFIFHLLCLKHNLAVSSACSEVQSTVVCVCQFQTPYSLPSYFPFSDHKSVLYFCESSCVLYISSFASFFFMIENLLNNNNKKKRFILYRHF